MPTTNTTVYYTSKFGAKDTLERRYSQWTNSPKVNGKLKLRSNPHTFVWSRMLKDTRTPYNRSHPWGSSTLDPSQFLIDWNRLETSTYQMFRRKLYQGSASLGVTIGSYKQSRSMIVSRYQQLGQRADAVLGSAVDNIRKNGVGKAAGSLHLEVIFGWMPLFQDIHAAATTVIQQAPVSQWIRVSRQVIQSPTIYANGTSGWQQWQSARLMVRSSRGALVEVTNPNVWLAERAGLLNVGAVAWDLVPWSFIINMVSNMGVLVNSITDYAGLQISNGYRVRSARGIMEYGFLPISVNRGTQSYTGRYKNVTLDPVAVPKLTYRIPEANWELAAMAASLFAQKFSRITSLFRLA